jgi:hypothetical protein
MKETEISAWYNFIVVIARNSFFLTRSSIASLGTYNNIRNNFAKRKKIANNYTHNGFDILSMRLKLHLLVKFSFLDTGFMKDNRVIIFSTYIKNLEILYCCEVILSDVTL